MAVIDLCKDPDTTTLSSLGIDLPPSLVDDVLALVPHTAAPLSVGALLSSGVSSGASPPATATASATTTTSSQRVAALRTQKEHLNLEASRSDITAEMKEKLSNLQNAINSKLYHQFLVYATEYVNMNAALTSTKKYSNVEFITYVIKPHLSHINQLTFVALLAKVISLIEGIEALKVAELFFGQIAGMTPRDVDAHIMFNCLKAHHLAVARFIKPCEVLLEGLEEYLNTTFGVDVKISSAYHRAAATLHKVNKNYSKLYRDALLYLAYTPLEDISVEQRTAMAIDLCVAAIVTPDVYNLGELIQHTLLTTEPVNNDAGVGWLLDILKAFNAGSLSQFDAAIQKNDKKVQSNEAVRTATASGQVRRKATLLTLVEMAFQKGKNKRVFTFDEIAAACRVNRDEVEVLAMTAMSAKLIKGFIDEVDGSVTVVWVRPRILDMQRIEVMKSRMNTWVSSAAQLLSQIEVLTPELVGKE